MKQFVLILAVAFASACSTTFTPRDAARESITAYVNRAADRIAATGLDCAEMRGPKWKSGDWYLFIFDTQKVACHGARPDLDGTPAGEVIDHHGKKIGEEFLRVAAAGGGWVDYEWPVPGQTTPVAKSSYVRSVKAPDGTTYIVGSGGYTMK